MEKNSNFIGWFYSKWYKIVILVLLISFLIGIIFSFFLEKKPDIINILFPSLINTIILWGGCMGIVIFVWKKFPWERTPGKHLFVEIALILSFLAAFILLANTINAYVNQLDFVGSFKSNKTSIVVTTLITFLIVSIHEAVFFYRQWKLNFSKSIRLEKDHLEAQYNALRAQVNPHFLFNSLNSLMSLLENNPKAEQYVQDLSEYLRYVLVNNSAEVVELKDELENLEKFFHLQQLRFNNNLQIEINVNETSLHKQLPPLALQMLVDNCIKHNTISNSKPLRIKIFDDGKSITVENNLQLKLSNESTGQGLKNIEGRFRFLTNRPIKIISDEAHFSVTIPLIHNLTATTI